MGWGLQVRERGFAGCRICHLLSVCQNSVAGEDPTESDGAGEANRTKCWEFFVICCWCRSGVARPLSACGLQTGGGGEGTGVRWEQVNMVSSNRSLRSGEWWIFSETKAKSKYPGAGFSRMGLEKHK